MDLGITDHTFIIGGGSRGLGFGSARALVAEGARVVLIGRSAESLARATEELGPDRAEALVADVADHATPAAAIELALSRFGRLDGALVNTGGPRLARVEELTAADWTTAAEEVFLAPVRLASAVIEHLTGPTGTGGALAFVLSGSVRSPLRGIALSNAIRPGLAMHVKDLADAYGSGDFGHGQRSVRVNGLLPARITTERNAGTLSSDGTPLGRNGDTSEFGSAAAFLLSSAASFITGALLPVDGGSIRGI